ncbi:hypothetical protein [Vulcanisaeta sp. JCM 16161]|uniref:hypothetical protein n=1 Tax=Vulcanisaeta sp. JCM 16161 TaxID=1295372 RepID=UPI001FB474AB|nr:hypothetical protein [Vulcanisaeta sp. JCM 16161]
MSNTLVLLMDMPVTVTINWIREYNTSLTLYTLMGLTSARHTWGGLGMVRG